MECPAQLYEATASPSGCQVNNDQLRTPRDEDCKGLYLHRTQQIYLSDDWSLGWCSLIFSVIWYISSSQFVWLKWCVPSLKRVLAICCFYLLSSDSLTYFAKEFNCPGCLNFAMIQMDLGLFTASSDSYFLKPWQKRKEKWGELEIWSLRLTQLPALILSPSI